MNVNDWIKSHWRTGDEGFEPSGECYPVDDRPGSSGKIRVLENRVQAGVPLWHKDDVNCFPEGGPC